LADAVQSLVQGERLHRAGNIRFHGATDLRDLSGASPLARTSAARYVTPGTSAGQRRWQRTRSFGLTHTGPPAEQRERSNRLAAPNAMAVRRQRWQTQLAVDAERTARCSRWFGLGSTHVRPRTSIPAAPRAGQHVFLAAILSCWLDQVWDLTATHLRRV